MARRFSSVVAQGHAELSKGGLKESFRGRVIFGTVVSGEDGKCLACTENIQADDARFVRGSRQPLAPHQRLLHGRMGTLVCKDVLTRAKAMYYTDLLLKKPRVTIYKHIQRQKRVINRRTFLTSQTARSAIPGLVRQRGYMTLWYSVFEPSICLVHTLELERASLKMFS